MQTPSSTICPVCKGELLLITDPESGEDICKKCGMIVSDKIQDIINRPEWLDTFHAVAKVTDRYYQRTGAPTSLARYDMGLSTVIARTDKDASGRKIDATMQTIMQRLRTWDSRAHIRTSSDISFVQAFNELDILKDKLALPDVVVEKSAYIYRKAKSNGLTRGRTISGLVAASVYTACREMSTPRTLKDIAAAANINHKYIAKAYRFLLIELDIKVPLVDQIKCIAKIANKANLTEKTKRQAISIMNEVRRNDNKILYSAGKNPMGLAATVLYISCIKTGENMSQKEISNAAGITEVTLRNRIKDLKNQLIKL